MNNADWSNMMLDYGLLALPWLVLLLALFVVLRWLNVRIERMASGLGHERDQRLSQLHILLIMFMFLSYQISNSPISRPGPAPFDHALALANEPHAGSIAPWENWPWEAPPADTEQAEAWREQKERAIFQRQYTIVDRHRWELWRRDRCIDRIGVALNASAVAIVSAVACASPAIGVPISGPTVCATSSASLLLLSVEQADAMADCRQTYPGPSHWLGPIRRS